MWREKLAVPEPFSFETERRHAEKEFKRKSGEFDHHNGRKLLGRLAVDIGGNKVTTEPCDVCIVV